MSKPLVSAVVITYKAEKYIKETLDSVFFQDYENLEIIITDDNSPDNTFSLIKQYVEDYNGPHKVIINQNNPNLGIAGNVNKGIELSSGEYICLFDGDDVAYLNRVSQSLKVMLDLKVEGMTANMEIIDSQGNTRCLFDDKTDRKDCVFGIDDYLCDNIINGGAARMFSRKTARLFGPLNNDCNTEDTTYYFRNILMGGIAYHTKPLVKYRIHDNNISKGANLYKRFNPMLIYKQYINDLNCALDSDLISKEVYDSIKSHLDSYLSRESTAYKLYHKDGVIKRFFFLLSIIFSKKYSIHFKKSLMLKFLSWTKNGF